MPRMIAGTLLLGLLAGCQQPMSRLNAPPHGTTEHPSRLQDNYAHMVDNAILQDMSVSDLHFVPHRAQLNALGEERLWRLATLLEQYGGAIRFSTDESDEDLVDARTEVIMTFLADLGIDTSAELVRPDLPGGRGMHANEAILIKYHEAMYQPGARGGRSSGGEGTPGGVGG